MTREIYHFCRYGPATQKRKKELGLVEFMKAMSKEVDTDGYAELRAKLVGDLQGEILEIGTGTGATFPYYIPGARVTAIEPNEEFRAAAEEAAKTTAAEIHVVPGVGEELPFEDGAFDAVTASTVLCSVASPSKTLEEFKRVLRPGGEIRLMEHVRSEHWLAGPMMSVLNPVWLRINSVGCNWDRKTVETVRASGFKVRSVDRYKIYSKAAPAVFPVRLIKAERPD
ncbi:MAG: class I SAM-dependent methyltransferase [bacterium]|nr:class I SAM-dependent methyltransferase [bacterium]